MLRLSTRTVLVIFTAFICTPCLAQIGILNQNSGATDADIKLECLFPAPADRPDETDQIETFAISTSNGWKITDNEYSSIARNKNGIMTLVRIFRSSGKMLVSFTDAAGNSVGRGGTGTCHVVKDKKF